VVAVALVVAVLGSTTPASAKDHDASLESWTSGFCSSVAHWFETTQQAPVPDPNGDQLLAIRRAIGDVVSDGHAWLLASVEVAPPVPNGKKVGARIRREFERAVAEVQRASDLLAGPHGSSSDTLAAAQRHLDKGYDQVVATMQRLQGHSGSPRLDQAMKDQCHLVSSSPSVSSSEAS
jgi:hypothetical protein